MDFVLGQPLEIEESLTCEFKEIRSNDPVRSIGKTIDKYVVAYLNSNGGSVYWGVRDEDRIVVGVKLNHKKRDLLKQVVGQKIAAIAPPAPPHSYDLPFHRVVLADLDVNNEENLFVVEVSVKPPKSGNLYLTEGGEAYKKTIGGKKKLSGSELITALLAQLQNKEKSTTKHTLEQNQDLAQMFPSVIRRAKHTQELIKDSRILWVDDNPNYTVYERTILSTFKISVDVALSTNEALFMLESLNPNIIISDIERGINSEAGLDLMREMNYRGIHVPVIYYIENLDLSKRKPPGSFAITNQPSELFHLIFDVLERG